ncbi:hypothetical protein VCUG_01253 [Vavraia culicis subsp. floridensis]|uniref:Uncharacterized protein n=1 Tax=Vavraia culicis (isolate floridensis) TaxID=948595 RepID=L2GV67_VAVCU|nr:uncharacterized protein VCUG_01253 [Vavraia culicis subsp. floridensis]ELA47257.1 hypothetical protein VCUG_01253 [Vavraia culicis subsp. floridensis]
MLLTNNALPSNVVQTNSSLSLLQGLMNYLWQASSSQDRTGITYKIDRTDQIFLLIVCVIAGLCSIIIMVVVFNHYILDFVRVNTRRLKRSRMPIKDWLFEAECQDKESTNETTIRKIVNANINSSGEYPGANPLTQSTRIGPEIRQISNRCKTLATENEQWETMSGLSFEPIIIGSDKEVKILASSQNNHENTNTQNINELKLEEAAHKTVKLHSKKERDFKRNDRIKRLLTTKNQIIEQEAWFNGKQETEAIVEHQNMNGEAFIAEEQKVGIIKKQRIDLKERNEMQHKKWLSQRNEKLVLSPTIDVISGHKLDQMGIHEKVELFLKSQSGGNPTKKGIAKSKATSEYK